MSQMHRAVPRSAFGSACHTKPWRVSTLGGVIHSRACAVPVPVGVAAALPLPPLPPSGHQGTSPTGPLRAVCSPSCPERRPARCWARDRRLTNTGGSVGWNTV